MFFKIFTIFAFIAVAFAAPSPKPEPAPAPQYLTYSAGLDYAYPSAAFAPSVALPYTAPATLAYSGYSGYSGYPAVNALYY